MVSAELFRQVPLFAGLEDEDLGSLISVASRRKYPKDGVIFFEQDVGDALFMILSGRVKVTILSDDGREIILAMLSDSDFFGEMSLLDNEPRSATAIALQETEMVVLHQRDFLSIVEKRPRVLINLLSVLSSRLRKANRQIGNLALHDVYGRVARILPEMASEDGTRQPDGRITFRRPTHQEIANMIGATRETVSRMISDLHRQGGERVRKSRAVSSMSADLSSSCGRALMLQRLNDQNHYQVLEVSYEASADEIQSAYEVARDIYSHDAFVSGSILSEHERRGTFDRIAGAYQTLIAEESRRLYDKRLGLTESSNRRLREPVSMHKPVEELVGGTRELDDVPEINPAPARFEPRKCPIQLEPSEQASGEFLRKARETMGLELSTISEETKIGRSVLESIESERIDRLPAPVYLRNFTRQIARCLGLDEERVSSSYMDRIRQRSNN